MNRVPSWPLDDHEHLAEVLHEQGATPEEVEALTPLLLRLAEWQAPQPSPADTQSLIARLVTALPAPSPVRQAIREECQHRRSHFSWLLSLAGTQVSLFGLAFWLVSALVTLLGAGIILGHVLPDQVWFLRTSGPLLAYLGTIIAFRGTGEHVLECELVCLPTPWQLALARLVIVLGYDIGLGLAFGLTLWVGGSEQVLALLLSWLMPLLLVAGLALLLSLRLSAQTAAALAYGSWLTVLVVDTTSAQVPPITPQVEVLLGGIGLALLAVALLCLRARMPHLLPRT